MNLQDCFDFLNFWINKETGAWYTIPELELITDRGQMSLYSDLQPIYATSQRAKDALSPFRSSYPFTFSDTLLGVVTIPSNTNYLNLLDLSINFAISAHNVVQQVPIKLLNEDERANRLNSQLSPVTATSPIGEQIGVGQFQLYPKVQYQGAATFLRRPVAPVFGYSVISGRVIVYNPNTSTQLEWSEQWLNILLLKTLQSIGINLSEDAITQWSAAKTQSNYQSENML